MALSDAETTAAHERLRERYDTLTPIGLLEIVRADGATGDDRLDALTVIQQMRADLDHAEYQALDRARPQVSWSALGAALGVTRQGAERRWLRLAPKATPTRDAEAGRSARRHRP